MQTPSAEDRPDTPVDVTSGLQLHVSQLDMYWESNIIFERVQTRNNQFPENTCEILMWWVTLKPEEATVDSLSLILRDMGLR